MICMVLTLCVVPALIFFVDPETVMRGEANILSGVLIMIYIIMVFAFFRRDMWLSRLHKAQEKSTIEE